MKPAPFQYHAPSSIEEATSMLSELGDDAKVLAGGQSLIPMLAMRLAMFGHIVDIRLLDELRGVERRDGRLWIGAGTTDATVGSHPDVAADVPLLAKATPFVGHFQIRNRGTIGGSLAHADAAAEYPAVCLALGAEFEAVSSKGRRTIRAPEFFTGMWSTALEDDEILTGLWFPVWPGRCGFAIEEIARRHGDFAVAGGAVALELDGDNRIRRCTISTLGLGSTPLRAIRAEAEIAGKALCDIDATELGYSVTGKLDGVPSDLHGSAAYRKRVGAVMVARAFASASEEALNV